MVDVVSADITGIRLGVGPEVIVVVVGSDAVELVVIVPFVAKVVVGSVMVVVIVPFVAKVVVGSVVVVVIVAIVRLAPIGVDKDNIFVR